MKRNTWSPEKLKELHYNQGLSINEIAEKFDIKPKSVRSMFWYHDVKIIHQHNEWSYDLLYDLYHNQQLSTGEIADMYGIACVTVQSQMSDYGVPFRSRSQAAQLRDGIDKYNESFFTEWSPGLAWYLGLMYADGSITQNEGEAVFASKDKTLVIKVASLLGSGVGVKEVRGMYRVGVYRKHLVEHLVNYGLEPNKTFIAKFPNVPEDYLSHFVRGLWDGDGSLYIDKRNRFVASFGSASDAMLYPLRNILCKHCNVRLAPLANHKGKQFWHIAYSSKDAISLCDWMYHDSVPSIRLTRKYSIYQKYLKSVAQK